MSRHWRVALVQASPLQGDDPVAQLAAELAAVLAERPDTQMVVFPEIHLLGASDGVADTRSYFDAVAEPLTGPLVQRLGAVAAGAGVWLVPGSIAERGDDGRVYNTALVFGPDGRLVSSYRKVFPWRPHEPWASGAGFTTFDVPGVGRMGLNICYDSWFPEATRQIAWLGAEVVFNIVKTTSDDRAQELVLARANAITNQIYYLSVNSAGPLGRGQSIYVGPEGEVLAEAPHADPEVTYLTIDLDRVTAVRTHGTAGVNRVWEQLYADDDPIDLPVYGGQLMHQRWQPQTVEPEGRS